MSKLTSSPQSERSGVCRRCGRPLSPTPLGLQCAPCLFASALGEDRTRIGDYELFEKIGEGATGVVHLARHIDNERALAIKLAKTEGFESGEALAIFRQEVSASAGLRHPHIAPVQRIEIHEGRPLLVMELFAGGTLADAENDHSRRDAAAILKTMLKIVSAVQFAHQQCVLHCDLKPENILLDEQGEPHVSDFGLARSIGRPARGNAPQFEGGTVGWMSPEQVQRKPLSTASDRFSLGLLLHWLQTGELLFGDGEDFAKRVVEDPRRPPGRWKPTLDWALRAIVYRLTQLEPEQRYASTAELAEDLERARDDRPLRAVPVHARARLWLYSRRHPFVSAAIFTLLCLCLVVVATAVFAAERQTRELRTLLLDMNAYAARGQAASALYALRDYADVVERAAKDPSLHEIAKSRAPGDRPTPGSCAEQTALAGAAPLEPYARGFDSLIVLNTSGCVRARHPQVARDPRLYFGDRDYFQGAERAARRGEGSSYVARAFRSRVSQEIRFALSAPLLEHGEWIGVVAATITARSTLDASRAAPQEPGEHMSVLLGPFEEASAGKEGQTRRDPGATSPDFAMLLHPNLPRGEKRMLDGKYAAGLYGASARPPGEPFELSDAQPSTVEDYVDPLLGGRWLAAFAPVGGTGYVILVQTRDTVAVRPSDVLTRRLATGLGAALCLALLLFGGFAWSARRPSQRRRATNAAGPRDR
jgi:eukaryotic-like serine/threonine-protein kinase